MIDDRDEAALDTIYAAAGGLSGNWKLSQGAGLFKAEAPAEGLDNRFGWRGYWYDPKLELYHVRHRVFDPREGRWMQTDPIGFAAGDQDLYRYTNGEYSMGYDPLGLIDGYGQTLSIDSNTGCTVGVQEYMFGRPLGPGEVVSGSMSAGTPLEQWSNYFAGWADALSLNATSHIRGLWDGNSIVDTNSGAYGEGALTGAIHLSLMSGMAGGQVAIANWGLRAGSWTGGVVGGAAGGMLGDAAFQGSMISTGMQEQYDPAQTLVMGIFGGGLGGAFHTLAEMRAFGNAAFNAQAVRTAANTAAGGGRGVAEATCGAGSSSQQIILRPVEITFPARGLSQSQRAMFAHHLAEQEATLNRLSLASPNELRINLLNYQNIGQELAAARATARGYLNAQGTGLRAAHSLDAAAGGRLHEFAGLRNAIQDRIGALWRTRSPQIVPGREHRLVPLFE